MVKYKGKAKGVKMEIYIKSKVCMPTGEPIYETDSKMDYLVIKCDRYYKSVDLSVLSPFLKIRYGDGSCNVCNMAYEKIEEKELTCKMVIDRNLTCMAGEVECQPMFKLEDGTQVFNCSVFTLNIKPSVRAYEYFEKNTLPSTIEKIEKEINEANAKFKFDETPNEQSGNAVKSSGIYSFVKNEIENSWLVDCTSVTSLTLADNKEFRIGTVATLTISLPESVETQFTSELIFTAGSNINVDYPDDIAWLGDDVNNNLFYPKPNKTYAILFINVSPNQEYKIKGIVRNV